MPDFKFGYEATSYTHHQKPHFYAELCDKLEDAWKEYDMLTDYSPIPYLALEEKLDECRSLEARKHRAYEAMVQGLDPEAEEIPF